MPRVAFTDESQRAGRLLVSTAVLDIRHEGDFAVEARRLLRPGQRRFHAVKSRPSERQALARVGEPYTDAVLTVVVRVAGRSPLERRRLGLEAVVRWLSEGGVERLVLDRHTAERHDGRTITRSRNGLDPSYEHLMSADTPGLWLPDLIAWSIGRGGEARTSLPDHWQTTREV